MKILILFFAGLLVSLTSYAHNPQLSTLTIIQEEGKRYAVLISVPLVTCQEIIQNSYSEVSVDSLDMNEFNNLLIDLIKKQSKFIINGSDTLTLSLAKINYGHEIEIYFQFYELVEKIDSMKVMFNPFSLLQEHNTILRVSQSNKTTSNFILNQENDYSLYLKRDAVEFVRIDNPPTGQKAALLPGVLLFFLVILTVLLFYKNRSWFTVIFKKHAEQ